MSNGQVIRGGLVHIKEQNLDTDENTYIIVPPPRAKDEEEEGEDLDEEAYPDEIIIEPGCYSDAIREIAKVPQRKVQGLWRGPYPLTEDDWIDGGETPAQFDEPTHLMIGRDRMDVVVKDAQRLYIELCAEFDWSEILLTHGGQPIEFDTEISGPTIEVWEIAGRPRGNRVRFPREKEMTIFEEEGRIEIQEWIDDHLGVYGNSQ
jgi:hypothetical protein